MRPPYGSITPRQKSWIHEDFGYRMHHLGCGSVRLETARPGGRHAPHRESNAAGIDHSRARHSSRARSRRCRPPSTNCRQKGFKFVTVSELLAMARPAPPKPAALPSRRSVRRAQPRRRRHPVSPGDATAAGTGRASRLGAGMIADNYLQLRTELETALAGLLKLSSEMRRDPASLDTLQGLLTDIREPLLFVVVGEVKAGKSSLLNALFGQEFAKVDVLPATDRVYIFRYGDTESTVEVSPHLTERYQPIPFLRDFNVVDTPGTNTIVDAAPDDHGDVSSRAPTWCCLSSPSPIRGRNPPGRCSISCKRNGSRTSSSSCNRPTCGSRRRSISSSGISPTPPCRSSASRRRSSPSPRAKRSSRARLASTRRGFGQRASFEPLEAQINRMVNESGAQHA